ncbi:MAG: CDP-diacylglycerol--glycerol-3-phosphate 3-phosphatidyltransferase [Nitrospirae bacterium]|nr:CDP-diacylglycerol--glycerol-3-phosphate 3-phosphatidyltransferase [Nitrospirota bacterium]
MNLNLPNTITLGRILLIPLFVFLAYEPGPWRSFWAAVVFLIAALTDLLDGYLARKHNQVTALGKLLDPVADKLLTLAGFVMLVDQGLAAAWIVIIILGREVAITGLRAIAAAEGLVMPADEWGKWKTVTQITAIIMLILGWRFWIFDVGVIGTWVLWVSTVLAVYSGARYGVAYLNAVRERQGS